MQEDKKKIGTETGDSERIVEIGREVEGVEVSIYMSETERYPLQTYMQSLLQNFEAMMKLSGTDYALLLSQMNAQTGRAAQLFLGAIPVMLVYPFLQKYFTTGLTLGSVKG